MLELFFSTFATLFITVDPLSTVFLFLALSAPFGQKISRAMATHAVLLATGILLFFVLAGNAFLGFLGITVDAFRISGGILLMLIAIEMVFERRNKRRKEKAKVIASDSVNETTENELEWKKIAIFPIAIPFLAGPAAMTSLLLLSSQYSYHQSEFWLVAGTVGVFMLMTWVVFWLGGALTRYITPGISEVVSRVLGVVLAALAVSYLVEGIRGAFGV